MGGKGNFVSIARVALLVGFLLSSIIVNSALTGNVMRAKADSPSSTMAVDPQFNVVSIGSSVTISVNVTNFIGLSAWQVALKYNATVLNLTGLWIPDDTIFANFTTSSPEPAFGTDVVDGLDYVLCGSDLLGQVSVNVSAGVLFSANFTGLGTGVTPIEIATAANPVHQGLWGRTLFYSEFLDINGVDMPFVDESGEATVGVSTNILTLESTIGGITNPSSGTYYLLDNSLLSVTALPELGYYFSNWQLDGVNAGSANPYNVTMDVNHTLQAVFLPHAAVTWTVDWRGGADFSSIQDAIDSPLVEYGDIILVKPGVYYENVDMTKELTLMGTDEDTTIIDGNGTGTVVSVYGNLTGFTIRNGEYGVDVKTIMVQNPSQGGPPSTYFEDSAWINGNRIVDNLIGGVIVGYDPNYPVRIPHDKNSTISNNYVANNTVYGIHIWDAWNNAVLNNTVENNEYGIDFYGGSYNNTLRDNNMVDNKYNFGVILRGETMEYYGPGFFFNNDVDSSNTEDGKRIYYWIDKSDAQVPSDAGYVLLCNCTDISVNNCSLVNNIEGVLAYMSDNTEIGENTIANNAYGIYMSFCENNTLIGNSLVDNVYGVYLGTLSKYTTMRDNSISGGQFNFGMDPQFYLGTPEDIFGIDSDVYNTCLANDIDGSNTLDGKPMVYWINQHDRQVPANAGFVMLINCTNISVEGLNLTNNLENIVIFASNNTMICNNYLANSVYNIKASDYGYLDTTLRPVDLQCFNVTVSDNTLTNNGIAIDLLRAENSTIQGNTLDGNPLGILSDTDYSTISRNTINDSTAPNSSGLQMLNDMYVFNYPASPAFYFAWEWSVELMELQVGGIIVGGNNNMVYGNTVTNSWYSIMLGDIMRNLLGTGNIVFHNNFINFNGPVAALDLSGGNQWDDGYPAGGNYWSDYAGVDQASGPYQNLTGSDGIGDTPYTIIIYNNHVRAPFAFDRYPLMKPFVFGDLNHDGKVDIKDIHLVASAFGSSQGDPNWNPVADVNLDGKVDIRDVALVAKNYGKHD
jgi:parallel beta-helix repeat protein